MGMCDRREKEKKATAKGQAVFSPLIFFPLFSVELLLSARVFLKCGVAANFSGTSTPREEGIFSAQNANGHL